MVENLIEESRWSGLEHFGSEMTDFYERTEVDEAELCNPCEGYGHIWPEDAQTPYCGHSCEACEGTGLYEGSKRSRLLLSRRLRAIDTSKVHLKTLKRAVEMLETDDGGSLEYAYFVLRDRYGAEPRYSRLSDRLAEKGIDIPEDVEEDTAVVIDLKEDGLYLMVRDDAGKHWDWSVDVFRGDYHLHEVEHFTLEEALDHVDAFVQRKWKET